jgi:pilus assembly protein CpaF
MRADRIIVGEVRSDEVLDMVQAMNTGHEGSMTTLHANSPFDAINRLEVLALMGSPNISSDVAKRQIITAIDLIIHMSRFADGSRKVSKISELVKGRDYAIEDIFALEDMGDKHAKLQYTGRPPTFYAKLQEKADYICKEFELKQIN